ncbi:UDP-glucose 4-epimerase [Thermobaculum terrenum ATCC BAA-798]|uniref:UDP-glucose 4-epimerase n=1 Tax=Thermobaculum terrenum (strain ATCC BAA-798 / CCMEE 7001 / YNP1) TaxID=525904 RepID=D1CH84_THET1|nr:UDP-glucose 4-epimerase GalE [Thermobaculum terrenum]ACZ43105.1 UDP-glucose 4-epimerase [Thermobaculum terrenum ATCC BAA-798]
MKVLVTGGAGYVGSVVVDELIARGDEVVVIDNLYQGHREAINPEAKFAQVDLLDAHAVAEVFDANPGIEAIMHFASHTLVGESMQRPELYLRNNIVMGVNLLEVAVPRGVRKFILSSTANLFGNPTRVPIDESQPLDPGSPYGESKLMLERILRWYERIYDLRYGALRYFNAAGATERRGEHHDPETHIIPLVLSVALGKRDSFTIYGGDYPTPDGTCIRDYVHVYDLAQAHLLTLDALKEGSRTYNLGNGQGFSNLQVVEAARKVTGHPIPTQIGPRRPGDPAVLVASSEKIRSELGWQPKYADLESIIRSAWEWHKSHPSGYKED